MSAMLTTESLQRLIRDSHPGVRLAWFEATEGSGRGDNYTAVLYRVQARGWSGEEPWKGSFILKALPENPETREAYQSESLFRNEVAFYTRALPALIDFQSRMGARSPFRGVPQCFRADGDLIVLEDLRCRGFRMADRKVGLDAAHLEAALALLARLHALSLAMRASEPRRFAAVVAGAVREVMFTPENEAWYRAYYRSASRAACAVVGDAFPATDAYLRRLRAFADDGFFQRMVDLVSAATASDPGGQRYDVPLVLCHGDCWTNNIMFRYSGDDDDRIAEACLLDFQMARVGSPALDLASLLYCCTSRELRRAHLDRLLEHYHGCLRDALADLGCGSAAEELLPISTLRREMARCSRFGLGIALDMIPISTCDSDVAPDLYGGEAASGGEAAKGSEDGPEKYDLLKAPPSEEGRRRMSELVQELVDNGFV
ncbi:uncharacterized protein LOC124156481 [Ischnura elegans]|uniref:uncharacterized protein LOC124156481 n=1 Tax=Ischnura elegans TaxID=197161 RepID=UPI001ED8BC59|nr:uncharacterized protein LOC124156481 [Ischnura elegans]